MACGAENEGKSERDEQHLRCLNKAMSNPLNNFKFAQFEFHLKATDLLDLPAFTKGLHSGEASAAFLRRR